MPHRTREKDENGKAKYNASAFEGVAKKDGKYYGLPSGTQHMVLYYNKTICILTIEISYI